MLSNEQKIKTFKLGIIAPRSFEDYNALYELIAPNLASISHIYTNNVDAGGKIVELLAKNLCISYTIHPIAPQNGGVFISNKKILNDSDFIYIFNDGTSHNAKNVEIECKKYNKKYKVIPFVSNPTHLQKLERLKTSIENRANKALAASESTIDVAFLEKLIKIINE